MKEIVEDYYENFIKVDEIDNLNNKIIAFKDNGVFILTCFDEGTISLKDNWFFTSLKAGVRFPSGLNHEDTYIFDSYKKEIISHLRKGRKIYQFNTYEKFAKWILEE